jgi:cytidylate kinase
MATDESPRPVVTISATYGAGGSIIGPQLAERLRVPFLDRAIATHVAEQLGVVEEDVFDDPDRPQTRLGWLLAYLDRAPGPLAGVFTEGYEHGEKRRVREETEKVLAHAGSSGGVILGRAGAVVLRRTPRALHVRLVGGREARLRQAMEIEDLDRRTAERRLVANDKARLEYVRRLYGVDSRDPRLYHLIIDQPVLGIEACVDVIVRACRGHLELDRRTRLTAHADTASIPAQEEP